MKIKTILPILALTLLFACDPEGKNKTTDDTEPATTNTESPTAPAIEQPNSTEKATATTTIAPHHFICYNNDDTPSMSIAIGFDENDKALSVKYKGQSEPMALSFLNEKMMNEGAHPTIETYYSEIYEGQENGVYKLTHSGNYDYAEYTSKKNGKKFNFTIDFDQTIAGDGYRTTPCY